MVKNVGKCQLFMMQVLKINIPREIPSLNSLLGSYISHLDRFDPTVLRIKGYAVDLGILSRLESGLPVHLHIPLSTLYRSCVVNVDKLLRHISISEPTILYVSIINSVQPLAMGVLAVEHCIGFLAFCKIILGRGV